MKEGDLVRVHDKIYNTHKHGILLEYSKIQKIAIVFMSGAVKKYRAADVTKAGKLDEILIHCSAGSDG